MNEALTVELAQLELRSKDTLINICRSLNIPTGDTARNNKGYYIAALNAAATFGPDAVLAALEAAGPAVRPTVAHAGAAMNPETVAALVREVVSQAMQGVMPAFEMVAASNVHALPQSAQVQQRAGHITLPTVTVVDDRADSRTVFGRSKLLNIKLTQCQCDAAPPVDNDYILRDEILGITLAAMATRENVWLYGPPGSGKTVLVEQIAARLGRPMFRLNFDASTERYDVIGGERISAGSTYWQDGVVLQALKTPHSILLLDELARARPEYLIALNPILERGQTKYRIAETGEVVQIAEGVTIIAADNTNGSGDSTGDFAARVVDLSTRSRFGVFIEMPYMSSDEEASALSKRTGAESGLANMLVSIAAMSRAKSDAGEVSCPIGLRELIGAANLMLMGVKPSVALRSCVVGRASGDDAEAYRSLILANLDEKGMTAAVEGDAALAAYRNQRTRAPQPAAPQDSNATRRAAADFS